MLYNYIIIIVIHIIGDKCIIWYDNYIFIMLIIFVGKIALLSSSLTSQSKITVKGLSEVLSCIEQFCIKITETVEKSQSSVWTSKWYEELQYIFWWTGTISASLTIISKT